MRNVALTLALAAFSAHADSARTATRSVTVLADGIYEIRHPDAPDGFPQGNTTVVIGERRVLVVDSCLLPSSTRQDIADIRRWTPLPVSYLVNTHWHFDHTLGNASYADAFPGIQIIAQTETAAMIAAFNPGAVLRYPWRAQRFKDMLASGKDESGAPLSDAMRRELQTSLAGLAPVVEEFKTATQRPADTIFDHQLVLDLGNREVRLEFFGKDNTAGDTIAYLPREKIAIVGDLLDHPVPYFFGGYPVDLVETLKKLDQLDAAILVPGHGEVFKGKTYIGQVSALVTAVIAEVERELNEGMRPQQVRETVPKRLDVAFFKRQFGGDEEDNQDMFDESFEGLVRTAVEQIGLR